MSESIAKLLESLLSQIPGRTPESDAHLAELCRQLRELQDADVDKELAEPQPLHPRLVDPASFDPTMSRDDEEILESIQAEIESLAALIQSTQGDQSQPRD